MPADGPPPTALDGSPQLPIPVWTRDERRYAIAFSSEVEHRRAAPGWAGSVRFPGCAYFAAFEPGLGSALNPGGSFAVALEPGDVARMRRTAAEEAAGSSFQLGEPAEEDPELLDAARTTAATRPEVRALRRARSCSSARRGAARSS